MKLKNNATVFFGSRIVTLQQTLGIPPPLAQRADWASNHIVAENVVFSRGWVDIITELQQKCCWASESTLWQDILCYNFENSGMKKFRFITHHCPQLPAIVFLSQTEANCMGASTHWHFLCQSENRHELQCSDERKPAFFLPNSNCWAATIKNILCKV